MEVKKYGTSPLVVCIRVPVKWIKEQKVKLMKSKLKSIRISKEELIEQFQGQCDSELEEQFQEEQMNSYIVSLKI